MATHLDRTEIGTWEKEKFQAGKGDRRWLSYLLQPSLPVGAPSTLAMETEMRRRRGEQQEENRRRGFEGFLKKPEGVRCGEEKESDRW